MRAAIYTRVSTADQYGPRTSHQTADARIKLLVYVVQRPDAARRLLHRENQPIVRK
jgi:hypothetical protein